MVNCNVCATDVLLKNCSVAIDNAIFNKRKDAPDITTESIIATGGALLPTTGVHTTPQMLKLLLNMIYSYRRINNKSWRTP